MPAAIDRALRVKLVQAHAEGRSYASLAREHNLAYNTVRSICIRYSAEGEAGLQPRYAACGPKTVNHDRLIYRAACALKRAHPGWGAALIRLHLDERYGQDYRIPALRTLQLWFSKRDLKPAESAPPERSKKEPPASTMYGK